MNLDNKIVYEVLVDDMYHYMDESERYSSGVFSTCEEAKVECMGRLMQSLKDLYTPNMTEAELKAQWWFYGEDPFIRSADSENCKFSAAKELDSAIKVFFSLTNKESN